MPVWHSSLTLENSLDLERVQKNALKVILQDNYISYNHALSISGIQALFERREVLCLRFAQSCVKNNQTKYMFPENKSRKAYDVKTRFSEKYMVTQANTERLKSSAIPYMQKLLNSKN